MASIASQLQSIRSLNKEEPDPKRRPITRPSILYDPRQAADIDVREIWTIALAGLEVLITFDKRFLSYKNDLFSNNSMELDREHMGGEENKRIDALIASYLRLLSGHFQMPQAVRTLEYLIRRYKIHVHNTEELILCALPFHETHVFVRIVQLLVTGESKWAFLDGVKASGAPPPRKVIVQHCMRDLGILEVICRYASPSNKLQPSTHAIHFCTAVIVEVLGSLTVIDTDVARRIIPHVNSCLQTRVVGSADLKAGALMVVSVLAKRAALSPKITKSLTRCIAEVALEDAKKSTDLQLFRASFMALINVVQLQSIEVIPKKTVDILNEIRDLPGVLSGLTKEYNIDKFLAVFLESLIAFSLSDDLCHQTLLKSIETLPIKGLVGRLVSKLLSTCVRLSKEKNELSSFESVGCRYNQILHSVNECYPLELRGAVQRFFEDFKEKPRKGESIYDALCRILDSSLSLHDSRIWFGLEHPQAEVRRAAILGLDFVSISQENSVGPQKNVTIQDALLRRLRDDDLSVVLAAIHKCKTYNFDSSLLLEALRHSLQRCIDILMSSSSGNTPLAIDVAVSCLELVTLSYRGRGEHTKELAALLFPLIPITPKTRKINLKALDSAKEIKWYFYQKLVTVNNAEEKLGPEQISSINFDNIYGMAEMYLLHSTECVRWFTESCHDSELSKTLFFLVLLQSFLMPQLDFGQLSNLYNSCFPFLKKEWEQLESNGYAVAADEPNTGKLNMDCKAFLDQIFRVNLKELNSEILICLSWRLLEVFIKIAPQDMSTEESSKRVVILQDLFVFFASHSKLVVKRQLHCIVAKCMPSPVQFLTKHFTEDGASVAVQVQSLHSFAFLCSQSEEDLSLQVFAEFPSILVPLFSTSQDIRATAMDCIEILFNLCQRANISGSKNGKNAIWSNFLSELLRLLVQQKRLIESDRDILPEFFTTLLSSSHTSLLVPETVAKSFDQKTKESILGFVLGSALKLCPYGLLMILSLLKGVGSKVILVKEVDSLLVELLKKRQQCHLGKSSCNLPKAEVEILCLLLECCALFMSSTQGHLLEEHILKALEVDNIYSEDPSILLPCLTVLRNLTNSLYGGLKAETQEVLFQELVFLFRSFNGDIQNATREALLRINVSCSTVDRMLDFVLHQEGVTIRREPEKKKSKTITNSYSHLHYSAVQRCGSKLSFLSSLLDVLLLKKDINNRISLVGSLFKLLRVVFMDTEWIREAVSQDEKYPQASSGVLQTKSSTMCYIQQNVLSILDDILTSLVGIHGKQNDVLNLDVELVIECARSASDTITRNHAFSLLSAIAKVAPDIVLDHIIVILNVIGESTVTQFDSYSQHVFEDLVSSTVPCWLSKSGNPEELIQVFVNILPEVVEHRRLSIVLHLLRCLGERDSLPSLLSLLFRSLASRKHSFCNGTDPSVNFSCIASTQWEYIFAMRISEQYSCMIWLPSLVVLLRNLAMGTWCEELFLELLVAMQFIKDKLQDPEIAFKIDSGEDMHDIQVTAGELMEQVVSHLQLVDSRRKLLGVHIQVGKEVKELCTTVLKVVTRVLLPLTYFDVTVKLLGHAERKVRRKALVLLCETAKDSVTLNQKHHKRNLKFSAKLRSSWLHFDDSTLKSFERMCQEILKLIDNSNASGSLRLAAISTLEVLAVRFPSNISIFNLCLGSVVKNICSDNFDVSCSCLQTTGALINVLGPRALPELPSIIKQVFRRSRDIPSLVDSKQSLFVSILSALEAVIDKLGGFLNPYLKGILELVVLNPDFRNNSDSKLKLKAEAVRNLITVKIPVRLSFPPLLDIYSEAIKIGDSSLSNTFEMLGSLVAKMDRSSIGAYHVKIFDMCLLALDLRHQHPASVKNIDEVEKNVINALIALTMKLTENMFKPLFMRIIDWAESHSETSEDLGGVNIDRAISFYALVCKLVESHRSLFVPYFKYLIDGLVRHLTDGENTKIGPSRKKKAKLHEQNVDKNDGDNSISVGKWHLRALIMSSLQKCFLFDAGSLKFLDSTNFQVLLKPIISQLSLQPPRSLEQFPNVPSASEVDDLCVACIGQMAVTSGSDLLWKPLNHEVLMQTRSEKVRTRLLALRIVKYLVDNLKEEYMVLLAETIPFLGELLEDLELPVKSLAQEILKDMESLSGESLRQYL